MPAIVFLSGEDSVGTSRNRRKVAEALWIIANPNRPTGP